MRVVGFLIVQRTGCNAGDLYIRFEGGSNRRHDDADLNMMPWWAVWYVLWMEEVVRNFRWRTCS